MIAHSLKEFSDKCSTIMDVVPKDATEDNSEFKNATQLMSELRLVLGDTGYYLIDIDMAKKMIHSRNGK
tara:strand:+ start:342 stop:548 length:207 start_codon:yes stop_codon:yes gene_type:complete